VKRDQSHEAEGEVTMSELFPTKTIALEYVSCTEQSREYEFNWWYDKVYIPDLLQTPGIAAVYRYRNVASELGEGQVRYLTLFRIVSNDAWSLMQRVIQEDDKKRAEQGRMIDCIKINWVTVWDFLAYRRSVSPLLRPETRLPDGMPEAMLVVPTICTDPTREEEFNEWYLGTHFHDLLETPGVVQAHRYRTLNPKPKEGEPQYLALYEIDSDDPAAVVLQMREDDKNIRRPQGRMINCVRLSYGVGTYQHIDL
jgi:hypothetical protein